MIQAASCVSFDLFDTLCRRRGVFFAKDVFAFVESEAGGWLGGRAVGLARMREEAESAARAEAVRAGRVETTLGEIYAILAKRLRLTAAERARLVETELDCERHVLEKDERAAGLYDFAVSTGKVVAVTTDTYFDEAFIKEICGRLGYSPTHFFVSSSIGKVKHDGSLFDVLLAQTALPATRILHIGDNPLSDVTAPSEKGLKAWQYLGARQAFQKRVQISGGRSGSMTASKILCSVSDAMTATSRDAAADAKRRAAASLGFLLLGFTHWLLQEARATQVKRIFFVAREGLLLKRCFDIVAGLHDERFDTRYLIASRTSLYPSLIFFARDAALSVFGRSWSKTTVRQAVERLSLPYDDIKSQLAPYGFDSGSGRLQPDTYDRFKAFMLDHWSLIEEANRQKCSDIVAYLRQERFLDDEDVMLVDLGWHLTLQRCLATLSAAVAVDRAIRGRYLGTFKTEPYDGDGDATGFVATYGAPQHRADLLRASPSLLEVLHGAHHGTVLAYSCTAAHKMEAVLEENSAESRQHDAVIAPLQAAALDCFQDWAKALARDGNARFSVELCAKIGLDILNHPQAGDAELLGGLLHTQDFQTSMKSITGLSEWDLSRIQGDLLPDGTVPMWRPGFEALRAAQRSAARTRPRGLAG